ncbi:MAG: integrase [Gammaproteobacteria bacterium CG11_big_fil_rev_8_21_14_0_20_46_22]|nr:MAG: integrase [Gammaproteobacteria bacterium CG12_big_fil_rev_8_21_14_0_65_46_12]PIR10067.1 MAG: integrase [Gammaproteobacteria bacterium CG11_big_fil_rev_8_21_14_0_20_46_22]
MVSSSTILPLFDTVDRIEENTAPDWSRYPAFAAKDFQYSIAFLTSYNGSQATFNAYRREAERLLHWAWRYPKKSVCALRRADIEAYLYFCQKPPEDWISVKKVPRFLSQDGTRKANPDWRPFVVTLPKSRSKQGEKADVKAYVLSEVALKEIFAILSSYYNFLIQEEATEVNPIAHIRQKSKYLRKRQGKPKIRRLSELQWGYVIETARLMAEENPDKHERTLFILSALYLMYLRISELAASDRWTPTMGDFSRDHDGNWWFTVVGKGNKEREIAVSDAMLNVLRRWRVHLNLTPLPSPADHSPLIPKVRGHGAISNTSFIRKIVQACFDESIKRLHADGFADDAAQLCEATVHWLRHTGISDDVKIRPREHVRDDAGHSSGAITDRYIDIERRERHRSAKDKKLSDE